VKKIVSVLAAIILVFCFSVNTFAETVKIEEYKLSFEIPEGWYAVTKDTPEDSEVFKYYLYYDGTMEYLEENGLLLYVISEDGFSDITVELEQTESYEGLESLSKSAIEKYCRETEETWAGYGYENCSAELYEGAAADFIKISYDYSVDGMRACGLDYIGFVDGVYCVIALTTYDETIPESYAETLKNIVDSILSENVVPENSSVDSGTVRSILKALRRLVPVIVALIAGLVAKAKGLFGKNKKSSAEAEVPSFEATEIKTESSKQIDNNFEDDLSANISESGFCCSSCGSPLSEDDKFCPLCGKKIK